MTLQRVAGLFSISLALVLLLGLAALYFGQRYLLYLPSHVDTEGKGTATFVPWKNGRGELMGYVREGTGPKEVVLLFHGNAGEALHRDWVEQLIPATRAVILVEYPGYGGRSGKPTEASLFAAAEEAFDEAQKRWSVPIVTLAESLGTGIASYLASKRPVARIALISPYSSMVDVGAGVYPFFPVRWLLRDRLQSVEHVKTVTVPLFVVHGEADPLIPIALARKLFDAYPGTAKQFLSLSGVGHNDIVQPLLSSAEAKPFRDFLAPW